MVSAIISIPRFTNKQKLWFYNFRLWIIMTSYLLLRLLFLLKPDEHMTMLSSFNTPFDYRLDNMSSNNIVVSKIKAETSELEATIEIKLDKITADH